MLVIQTSLAFIGNAIAAVSLFNPSVLVYIDSIGESFCLARVIASHHNIRAAGTVDGEVDRGGSQRKGKTPWCSREL